MTSPAKKVKGQRRLNPSGALLSVLLIAATLLYTAEANDNLRVAYQWKQVDFNYPSASARASAIASGAYIPENVIPVGLEVYKSRLFMTLPRWKAGVPASLVYIDMTGRVMQILVAEVL